MKQRSRYDELHDQYHTISSTKAGTRYERLAAIVFKILEQHDVVIHDLKLIGESEVKHQIDVSITKEGVSRRVLIECKDFSESGEKVGLGILRDFRSVIEDTKADESIVLTCNGYTSDAQKYAKAKNIKLAVLREIQAEDLEGLIQTVVLNFHLSRPANFQMSIALPPESGERYRVETQKLGITGGVGRFDPVFAIGETERIKLTEFAERQVNSRASEKNSAGRFEIRVPSDGWDLQVELGTPIPFDSVTITFDEVTDVVSKSITSDRIAELLLIGVGDDDVIIFGDQLERRKIDPHTGEIL